MLVLGIETSCDETAAALVTDGREICANIVLSQLDEHAPYGGIVPEIAALDLASRRAQRQLREHGLRTPDWAIGLRDRGRLNRESLERALAVVPPGVTELNCHPGTSRAELAKHYSWGYEWDSELAALLDPALPELLRERGIELMSYHDFRGP